MGRDDSWPATVPSVVPSLRYSLSEKSDPETPRMAEPYFRSRIWWQWIVYSQVAKLSLTCCQNACRKVFARSRHVNVRLTYSQHSTPSMRGIPSSYWVHVWCGKTRMAVLQSGEGRMMVDSVVWAQCINVTDTQTATQTHVSTTIAALRSGGKNRRIYKKAPKLCKWAISIDYP